MKQSGRVDRLFTQVRALVGANPRVRKRHCRGVGLCDLVTLVEQSIPRDGADVFDTILSHVADFAARSDHPHGFVVWVCRLQEGWADLPETVPLSVLQAWKNGYLHHPTGATPLPSRRCEACRMALPDCDAEGSGECISPCPVCGSTRISNATTKKPGAFVMG
jgi:hypothetical protein